MIYYYSHNWAGRFYHYFRSNAPKAAFNFVSSEIKSVYMIVEKGRFHFAEKYAPPLPVPTALKVWMKAFLICIIIFNFEKGSHHPLKQFPQHNFPSLATR